jgi:hypothetical protein
LIAATVGFQQGQYVLVEAGCDLRFDGTIVFASNGCLPLVIGEFGNVAQVYFMIKESGQFCKTILIRFGEWGQVCLLLANHFLFHIFDFLDKTFNFVIAALVAAIHRSAGGVSQVTSTLFAQWITGTSPAMTKNGT